MADLEHRLRGVVNEDFYGREGLDDAPESARQSPETRSMDWGWIYGLAYAIARAEDPFEPTGDVEMRANAAAKPVYAEYVGEAQADEVAR